MFLRKNDLTINKMIATDRILIYFVCMDTTRPPKNSDERQVWIMAMLRMKKSSYSSLARELGVTRSAVRKAVWHSYPKMERAIAAKIGYVPSLIWPERYIKDV
ncbi:MAG: helix-turn-helix domain-containing protein [Desulfuromonadales bacterium]|nr:helix-turn-helix domain-containing protein [Desulfuromonadales bacterium]